MCFIGWYTDKRCRSVCTILSPSRTVARGLLRREWFVAVSQISGLAILSDFHNSTVLLVRGATRYWRPPCQPNRPLFCLSAVRIHYVGSSTYSPESSCRGGAVYMNGTTPKENSSKCIYGMDRRINLYAGRWHLFCRFRSYLLYNIMIDLLSRVSSTRLKSVT